MNRRTLLGTMGGTQIALFGGCIDRTGDQRNTSDDDVNNRSSEQDGEPTDTDEESDTEDDQSGPPASERTDVPAVSIEETETDGSIDFDATVKSQGEDDNPPKLTFELTNTAPETRIVGDFAGTDVPFNQAALSMEDRGETVQLIAPTSVEEFDGCWVSGVVDSVREFATLDPEETLTADVAIVTGGYSPDDESDDEKACYGVGKYSTERSFVTLPETANPSETDDYEDQIIERPEIALSVSVE